MKTKLGSEKRSSRKAAVSQAQTAQIPQGRAGDNPDLSTLSDAEFGRLWKETVEQCKGPGPCSRALSRRTLALVMEDQRRLNSPRNKLGQRLAALDEKVMELDTAITAADAFARAASNQLHLWSKRIDNDDAYRVVDEFDYLWKRIDPYGAFVDVDEARLELADCIKALKA